MTRVGSDAARAFEQFGFTNDAAHVEAVRAFVQAAVADGWSIEPTYPTHESVESAARLKRDGYVLMVLSRDRGETSRYRYEAKVSGWGPDGLSIRVPKTYSWDAITSEPTTCRHCGATGVETFRYSFAGRACPVCVPGLRAMYERPGWDA